MVQKRFTRFLGACTNKLQVPVFGCFSFFSPGCQVNATEIRQKEKARSDAQLLSCKSQGILMALNDHESLVCCCG